MSATRTGNKRLLRDLNQSIVFNMIVERGSISRTEPAKQSGLPAATITRIVGNFLSAGLVSEVSSEESSGGRRPGLLSINPSAGYIVGGKLREDSMTMAICGLNCTLIYALEQNTLANPATLAHRASGAIVEAVKRRLSEPAISD